MSKWKKFLIVNAVYAVLCAPGLAEGRVQQPGQGGTGCDSSGALARADLPASPKVGTICTVNDARTELDCNSGGSGSLSVMCRWDGDSWEGVLSIGDPGSANRLMVTNGTTPFGVEYTDAIPGCDNSTTGGAILSYNNSTRDFGCDSDIRVRSLTSTSNTAGLLRLDSDEHSGTLSMGTGSAQVYMCDDSGNCVGVGHYDSEYLRLDTTNSPLTAALTIQQSTSQDAILLHLVSNVDINGNAEGLRLSKDRGAGVGNDADAIDIDFYMTDSASNQEYSGLKRLVINDVTDGTEDTEFQFMPLKNSFLVQAFSVGFQSSGAGSVESNPALDDIDFEVHGDTTTDIFKCDAGTEVCTFLNTPVFSGGDYLLLDTSNGPLTDNLGITTASTSNGDVSILTLRGANTATPANGDEVSIIFEGEDSAGNPNQEYGRISGGILDPTTTSEDGRMELGVVSAGTQTVYVTLQSDATGVKSIFLNSGTEAIDTIARGDTDTNLLRVDASTDTVGIGQNNGAGKLNVLGTDAAVVVFRTKAALSQTADVVLHQNNGGTDLFQITAAGLVKIGGGNLTITNDVDTIDQTITAHSTKTTSLMVMEENDGDNVHVFDVDGDYTIWNRAGDHGVTLLIRGDPDNDAGEPFPTIRMTADNAISDSRFQLEGASGETATGTDANSLIIGPWSSSDDIHFVAGVTAASATALKWTIENSGELKQEQPDAGVVSNSNPTTNIMDLDHTVASGMKDIGGTTKIGAGTDRVTLSSANDVVITSDANANNTGDIFLGGRDTGGQVNSKVWMQFVNNSDGTADLHLFNTGENGIEFEDTSKPMECIFFSGRDFVSPASNGATQTQIDIATGNRAIITQAFATAADDSTGIQHPMPENISTNTTDSATVTIWWSCPAGACDATGGDDEVCWFVDIGGFVDGEAYTGAPPGSSCAVSDTGQGDGIIHKAECSQTPGIATAGEYFNGRIVRDVSGGTCAGAGDDDLAADAYLHAVRVCFIANNALNGEQ